MKPVLPWRVVAPILVVGAGILAYHNSFFCPFLFDDKSLIVDNPILRDFWTSWRSMAVSWRPVVDVSFALNMALGGLRVWGYHAFNLAIHLTGALLLMGVVHRTLQNTRIEFQIRRAAPGLALVVALLWVVHPLQTQGVTYLVQRSESLMGLFYLLTLYSVIRSVNSHRPQVWISLAIVSSALGMGCKAVIVTVPLVILLYDRLFLSDSFREAWRERKILYWGLMASWGLLAAMVVLFPENQPTVGFSLKEVSALEYAATQPGVILHYLGLALRPRGLVFDYAWPVARTWNGVFWPSLAVAGLLAATIWGYRRRMALSFLGVWFFLILAPTSSFIPLRDLAFEHRMYLPLAAVMTLVVVMGWHLLSRPVSANDSRIHLALGLLVVLGVSLSWATIRRNYDYRSELSIWSDTVVKRPNNPRAHLQLGNALNRQGRSQEAVVQYHKAIQLKPDFVEPHHNLSRELILQGNFEEAMVHSTKALQLAPRSPRGHLNLGNALLGQGKVNEAIGSFSKALELEPSAKAYGSLGIALAQQGRLPEAVAHYEKALQLQPSPADQASLYFNLGNALTRVGRLKEALRHYQTVLQLKPGDQGARQSVERLKNMIESKP